MEHAWRAIGNVGTKRPWSDLLGSTKIFVNVTVGSAPVAGEVRRVYRPIRHANGLIAVMDAQLIVPILLSIRSKALGAECLVATVSNP
jgi:hypothetical protein